MPIPAPHRRHQRFSAHLLKLVLFLGLAGTVVSLRPGLAEICGQPELFACGP